ncbi:MAG: hypothetical protein LQ347_005878 [Umbilicaria vellea]|nr:MAG: hypothetical protein LQ347_005878 [Umbilicaria vellea]
MADHTLSPASDADGKVESKPTLTPPASEEADQHDDSGSDLSDLEGDGDDIGEIVPDHYYEGGKIPVFKPTMKQFQSFKDFIQKIDRYGMKSGIVKVVPPKEWRDALPALDEPVKTIKVKNPITQEFHGQHGSYTQANIEKQRSYNLPQWKALCEESNHQPPAKRGERRRNQEKATRGASTRTRNAPASVPDGKKRGPGRPRVRPFPATVHKHESDGEAEKVDFKVQVPPTPPSPSTKPAKLKTEHLSDGEDSSPAKTKGRQPKSVSSRRQYNQRDQGGIVDEEAFKDFDYRVYDQNEWTPERCKELEVKYWQGLTFNNPMYGADMPGSLFDDSTQDWNVAKLDNILEVLGQKVPGVNTAYLYLGMWKATFAWHLEDVDLYSINYIHFGAPKQWYSISQDDARRFEAAMKSVWPNDAKNCDQFLRHKTYLISPQLLQSQYNIRVNKLVHNEGEFVITFPYGYHSGYNLGYNCAESVNFATESWLQYGKIAKKCYCEADSVWVDADDIERKLRGEPTPEYFEETDDDEEDEDEDEDNGAANLPTPPGSVKGKPKPRIRKRKQETGDKDDKPKKKMRITFKAMKEICILCPSDNRFEKLLPTDNGKEAHRRCALYTPETYIAEIDGSEVVCDVAQIDKARLELNCNYCRNKRGAVFQCSQRKCTRAYHATCAAAAGVQVDVGIIPVFDEDGTEYTDTGIDYRCRFHRIKRGKHLDGTLLEEHGLIRRYGSKLGCGDVVQVQYYQSDIWAGTVLENRKSEQILLVEVLPKGDTVEVEYKWLLVLDPVNSQLPIPSANAKPLPAHLIPKSKTSAQDPSDNNPKQDEPFCDPKGQHVWAEFHTGKPERNAAQVRIDLSKPKQLWFYLGRTSTEAKAQYTGDLKLKRNDLDANFLESVKPPPAALPPTVRRSYPASYPSGVNQFALNAAQVNNQIQQARQQEQALRERAHHGKYAVSDTKPYEYKPKVGFNVDPQALHNQQAFQRTATMQPPSHYNGAQSYRAPPAQMGAVAPMAPMTSEGQRRLSAQSSKGLEDYRQWTEDTHKKLQQQQQANPRPQAPVANMTGASSKGPLNPFCAPSTSLGRSSVRAMPIGRPSSSGGPHSHPLTQYPYLITAERQRARVYQSPYAHEGGFTATWLPCPEKKEPQRGLGLSEEFLMTRTPSQQEHVKTHVRQMSQEKALQQQQQKIIQQQQHHLKQQELQRKQSQTHVQMAQTQFEQFPYPQQNYGYQPQYAAQPNPYQHPQYAFQQPGLQFQSPQDFQLQVRREAQQQDWTKGHNNYESYLKGWENGNDHTPRQKSQLKPEMSGSGSEMLPMMDDPRF